MRTALTFYEKCNVHPNTILCKLIVKFENEEGMDAGVLLFEFFKTIFREINDTVFEGEEKCHVSKKDLNMEQNFKLVGAGCHCLCPPSFKYLFMEKEAGIGVPSIIEDTSQMQQLSAL